MRLALAGWRVRGEARCSRAATRKRGSAYLFICNNVVRIRILTRCHFYCHNTRLLNNGRSRVVDLLSNCLFLGHSRGTDPLVFDTQSASSNYHSGDRQLPKACPSASSRSAGGRHKKLCNIEPLERAHQVKDLNYKPCLSLKTLFP